MKRALLVASVIAATALGVLYIVVNPVPGTPSDFDPGPEPIGGEQTAIDSFEDCTAAGYPVMESYPRQCRTPQGETFVEHIGNELEKADLIRITSPRPNDVITSPLVIEGEARGYWFFEANFPVLLTDWDGLIIAQHYAELDFMTPVGLDITWMTEEFVPFRAELVFASPYGSESPAFMERGALILAKSNASGLPEHDDALEIPVRFAPVEHPADPLGRDCRVTGCSGQICSDEDVVTTCEYREAYACYENALCERQEDGECGWTQTDALTACLNQQAAS